MPCIGQYNVLIVVIDLQAPDHEDANESKLPIQVHLQFSNRNGRDNQKCEVSQRVECTESLFWNIGGKGACALDKTLDTSW